MKKWLILLWAIPIALRLSAQQKFFEEPIGWHGKNIELHTISDRGNLQHCLFLMNSDSVRVFLMDNNQTVVQRFYIPRTGGEDFMGGFIRDKKIYAFFQGGSGGSDLHGWTLDIVGGTSGDFNFPFAMKHERAVEQINCGDHFLFFSVNRKASQFTIYDFLDDKRCDTLSYQFEPKVWKALTSVRGMWNRDMNVTEIDPDGECSTEMAKTPNKIYWMKDTLFLLMNHYEKGVTTVFSFDIRGRQVGFRRIVHNNAQTLNPPLEDYVDNSMLLDDKLYFVSAESGKLNLQIRDFHSGRMVREYTAKRDEDIAFKNSPIIQEGGAYSRHETRELGKTRQLLRKMTDGSALIVARREDSGRVGLTIGSYKKVTNNGYAAGYFAPVTAIGELAIVTYKGFTFFRGDWSKSARFKTLLDTTNYEHMNSDTDSEITERVEDYTKDVSIPPAGENLFRNSGKYVYAYYNRDEHKLMLVNF